MTAVQLYTSHIFAEVKGRLRYTIARQAGLRRPLRDQDGGSVRSLDDRPAAHSVRLAR